MSQETNVLANGYQLQEYSIESVLGTGGFGITYKARDTHLDSCVALKEYFPAEWSYRGNDGVTVHPNSQGQVIIPEVQTSGYEWGLDRFLDEARVLARVRHPYVVRIRRYFRANGTAYIVMDYEEGEPLSALLRRQTLLSEQQLYGLLQEVLPALEAVHEEGYLHRDLKPSNLSYPSPRRLRDAHRLRCRPPILEPAQQERYRSGHAGLFATRAIYHPQ